MRIIISGGGTGGHIYPAITIAKTIASQVENCEILFVGTTQGLEADIVPKEGFAFATVEVRGLERKLSWKNIQTVFKTMYGVGQALNIIRNFKPDIVIGTGGYVCGPVLLSAVILGVPTMIQEQNVVPGVTNRILARVVKKIACGYSEVDKYFGSRASKVVVTGNPIRAEVVSASREEGIEALGLNPDKLTILVVGGSRGAKSINNAMIEAYKRLAGRDDIQVLHVTGQNEYNNIVSLMEQNGIHINEARNIMLVPYIYKMHLAFAATDIAIFRAGALGLAELTAKGIPAILIPYPYAAGNHQEYNARVMEKNNAAFVIKDSELTGERLLETLEKMLCDRSKLAEMARASLSLGHPDAADRIAKLAISLAKESG